MDQYRPVALTINVSNVTHTVEPRSMGCHSDSGYVHNSRALYSEMLYGVCFDSGLGSSWTRLAADAEGAVTTDPVTRLYNKTSLQLQLATSSRRAQPLARVGV